MGFRFGTGDLEIVNSNFLQGPMPDPTQPGFTSIEETIFFNGAFSEQTRCFTAQLLEAGIPTFSFGFLEEVNSNPVTTAKEFRWFSDGTKIVSGSLQQLLGSQQLLPTDNKWFVDGTLVIDVPNFTMFGNNIRRGKIQFAPDGRIVVNSRSNFIIDQTDITACTAMWDRIEVHPGGQLSISNSEIWDGTNAVFAHPFSQISLTDNKFINNEIGLVGNGGIIRMGAFSGNSFNAFFLRSGGFGRAAVELNNVWDISLTGSGNKIFDLNNGVVASNSNFSLSGCEIFNLLPDGNFDREGVMAITTNRAPRQMTIANCSFKDLRTGVHSDNMVATVNGCVFNEGEKELGVENGFHGLNRGQAEISDNEIHAKLHGVFADNLNMLQVKNNKTIEVIGETGSEAQSFAIRVESPGQTLALIKGNESIRGLNAGNTIRMRSGNILFAEENAVSNSFDRGQGINVNGIRNIKLYCNGIEGTGGGASNGIFDIDSPGVVECNSTMGSSTGVNFTGLPGNVRFKGNSMMGNQIQGLLINGGGTAIGQQSHRGNIFLSDATHNGSNASASHFEVHTDMLPFFPPSVNVGFGDPDDFFSINEEGEPFECADAECGSGFEFPDFPDPPEVECEEFTVLDGYIADGSLNTGDMRGGNWWTAQRQLLDKIRIPCPENPPVMPPDVLAFANAHESSDLGQLLDVTIGIRSLDAAGNTEYQAMENIQKAIDTAIEVWKDLANQLEDETLTESEIDNLILQQDATIATIEDLQSQKSVAWSNYLAVKVTLANQLLLQNDAVEATSLPAQNEQSVSSIYLQTFAIGAELNAGQLNTLFAIGSQCPQDGGVSIHKARAMYATVHPEVIFSDESCDSQGEFRISSPTNNPSVVKALVSPNPTNGIINVGIPIDEIRVIKIINNLGQELINVEKDENQLQIPIDLSNLKSGLYFVQIWNKDVLESVEKISLLK